MVTLVLASYSFVTVQQAFRNAMRQLVTFLNQCLAVILANNLQFLHYPPYSIRPSVGFFYAQNCFFRLFLIGYAIALPIHAE